MCANTLSPKIPLTGVHVSWSAIFDPSPTPPRIQGGATMHKRKFSSRIRGELEGGKAKSVPLSAQIPGELEGGKIKNVSISAIAIGRI